MQQRLGIAVLIGLSSVNVTAEFSRSDSTKIGQQLQRHARDLRNVVGSMRAHARTAMPEGLNKDQAASLAAQRRDLEAIADDTLKLAIQVENRENRARAGTLTRADMDSLGGASDALARRVKRRGASASGKPTRASQDESLKGVESNRKASGGKQTDPTAFQHFDEQANQRYNSLISLLNSLSEMRNTGAGSKKGL